MGRLRSVPIATVMAACVPSLLFAQGSTAAPEINQADTAWMLTSTALVLLMTPALAFFYGGPSYYGLQIRARTSLDNALDVVAAHGVGGTVGALLTGVFAQKSLNGVADGVLFGNPGQLGIQAVAVLAAIVYSGTMSFVLLKVIGLMMPLRADERDESTGLDETQHGEEAYGLLGGVTTMAGHGG